MGNAVVAITVSYISAALGFFLALTIYRAKPEGFLNRVLAASFFSSPCG